MFLIGMRMVSTQGPNLAQLTQRVEREETETSS